MTDYRILITGTRDDLDERQKGLVIDAIVDQIEKAALMPGRTVIIHGACPTGVDDYVDGEFSDLEDGGIFIESYPADWSQHMVDLGADVCLAFPHGESRGTRGYAKMADAAGIPTIITEL